jgi:hypothetical protein
LFRNLTSPISNKELTAFLRHSDQCLFPSPQNDFCPQIYPACSRNIQVFRKVCTKFKYPTDLKMGFNSAFKGLKCGAAESFSKGLHERPEMVEVQGAHQTVL